MKSIKPYQEEFKKRAVEMLRTSGKPAAQIARELGCTAELKRENARLRKELNYVTEQRETFKKVAVILGQ